MSEPLYTLLKQVNDDSHPTGWTAIKKNLSFQAANIIAANRERLSPWSYNSKNPQRIYHLIEPEPS